MQKRLFPPSTGQSKHTNATTGYQFKFIAMGASGVCTTQAFVVVETDESSKSPLDQYFSQSSASESFFVRAISSGHLLRGGLLQRQLLGGRPFRNRFTTAIFGRTAVSALDLAVLLVDISQMGHSGCLGQTLSSLFLEARIVAAAVEDLEVEDAQQLLADLGQLSLDLLHALGGRFNPGANEQQPKISSGLD